MSRAGVPAVRRRPARAACVSCRWGGVGALRAGKGVRGGGGGQIGGREVGGLQPD